jgi:hypothetical protein
MLRSVKGTGISSSALDPLSDGILWHNVWRTRSRGMVDPAIPSRYVVVGMYCSSGPVFGDKPRSEAAWRNSPKMALVLGYRFGTFVAFCREIICMPRSTLPAISEFIPFMLHYICCDFDAFQVKSFNSFSTRPTK